MDYDSDVDKSVADKSVAGSASGTPVRSTLPFPLPASMGSPFPLPASMGSQRTPRLPPHAQFTPVESTPLAVATPRRAPLARGDVARNAPATPQGWDVSSSPVAPAFSPVASGLNEELLGAGSTQLGAVQPSVIWGTNINIDACMLMFADFIESYTKPNEYEPYYIQQLGDMHAKGETILNLDCSLLLTLTRSKRLYEHLVAFPNEVIPVMDKVVNERIYPTFVSREQTGQIQVRTFGLDKLYAMRDLDPVNIDQLVSIRGMVVRCSSVIPELKQALFRCVRCPNVVEIVVDKGRINEPTQCSACRVKDCMEIVHNRCKFADKQLIRLQESVDEIPEGETPQTVSLFAFDDLVDSVRPGDRVVVTGLYRAIPRRVNPRVRNLMGVYKTYIDTVHLKKERSGGDNSSAAGDGSGADEDGGGAPQYSEAKVAAFEEFVRTDNVYDKLVHAFAPSIWEMEDVKRGVLCQLFGGSLDSVAEQIRRREGGEQRPQGAEKTRLRGDINILLCGDPGTSKSQILSYVHKMSARGIYTSGKGSSAVGLTASVVRDPETKDSVLESGALVLSDNGICCIDEFDKMSDVTRAILHEAMEQQTVSITKAGIIATLNARTSILASANPIESRYNARLSVVENIQLPPTLLSRFDLIYLILDKPNADADRRLARHLVSLYYSERDRVVSNTATVTQEFLRDFISYARSTMAPDLSEEAGELLVSGYLEMRAMGNRGAKTITATPRQLESLIRISQALAKMRLARFVTRYDVLEAIRLMRVATQAAATDPRTGTIDMDLINTGRSVVDKNLVLMLADELRRVLDTRKGQRLSIAQLRVILSEHTEEAISPSAIEEAVRELDGEGVLQYNERTLTAVIR